MKKVLFVVPHLSTGGLPQYTLSLIKKIINDVDVYCVEYSMISPAFIVQRSQIQKILGDKFYSLESDKLKLIDIIDSVNPDIVHLQELPEYFIQNNVANILYSVERKYCIVETSHDSSFNSTSKRFFPDYFALISEYQREEFLKLNIPITLVESDIEYKERPDRKTALEKFGLDPNIKHILNVGLFTPRKNQAEIFDYARRMLDQPVQFHFVGNQADNFKDYWNPLLINKPSNVKIWGERSDVDSFYSCMDLFLFTSRGTGNDKETSPLVIREALGHRIPLLIYNLPVYTGMYDKYESIEYLDFNNKNYNINKILESINLSKINNEDDMSFGVFNTNYDNTENKIYYSYTENLDNVVVSVRDIDSNVVIWSSKHEKYIANTFFWMIPIPKSYYDFETSPTFGGFTVELYSNGMFVDSKRHRIKTPTINKKIIELKNITEPIFFNYNEFFIDGIYDPYLKGKTFDTIVDVGANVGMWIEYIKSVANTKKIYAIEPNKIALNILSDSFDDVDITESALHTSNDTLNFYTDNQNSLTSSIKNHSNFQLSSKVNGITIKTFVSNKNISKINLLKVDIESAEYDLFNSFDSDDFGMIDNILVEYHLLDGKSMNDAKSLENLFKSNGYKTNLREMTGVGGFIFATKNM